MRRLVMILCVLSFAGCAKKKSAAAMPASAAGPATESAPAEDKKESTKADDDADTKPSPKSTPPRSADPCEGGQ